MFFEFPQCIQPQTIQRSFDVTGRSLDRINTQINIEMK